MRKKGVTLIELVIVMAILSILFASGAKVYDFYKSTKSVIEAKEALYDIEESLSYSKLYCNNEEIAGTIVLSKINDEYSLIFYGSGYNEISSKIIRGVKLYNSQFSIVINRLEVKIQNNGVIDAMTIRVKDKLGKKYEIAISVGSNKISMRNC